MIKDIKDKLNSVLELPLKKDMVRYKISNDSDEWLQIEYKDMNGYSPSEEGYTRKLLCARNCYDSTGINSDGDITYKYGDPKDISKWVVLILVDKMLGFSQDVNGIQHDFDLVRKKKI